MNYETYEPGDGYKYPFVWEWSENIKGLNQKERVFIGVTNGKFHAIIFKLNRMIHKEALRSEIVNHCGCNYEQAMVVIRFIELKVEAKAREDRKFKFTRDKEEEEKEYQEHLREEELIEVKEKLNKANEELNKILEEKEKEVNKELDEAIDIVNKEIEKENETNNTTDEGNRSKG